MNAPRTRKSAADRRAQIVETAIRLSADMGPDRVTTQHLADAVGVTQPAVFRHFATKADIWLAVGDHIVETMSTLHAHAPVIESGDPHSSLKSIVGHHFVHIENNPAIPAIMNSRELHAEIEPLRERFSSLMDDRRAALAKIIAAAQHQGVHRIELAAEDAAHLVVAAMHGISMRWILENRAFDLAEEGGRVVGSLLDTFRA